MKNSVATLSLFLLLILSSCGGKKTAVVTNASADGQVKIKVEGKRESSIDSWKVEMHVKAYDFKEGLLAFEVYADDLNDQTVIFNWTDNKNCIISIARRDEAPRKFQLITDASQIQLAEIDKN